MPATIELVRKLIALAKSPNENEARNAAMKAVAMINAHGFHVVETIAQPTVSTPEPSTHDVRVTQPSWQTTRCVWCKRVHPGPSCGLAMLHTMMRSSSAAAHHYVPIVYPVSDGLLYLRHMRYGFQLWTRGYVRRSRMPKRCVFCDQRIPNGVHAYRPTGNGLNRMHRVCVVCAREDMQ